MANTVSNVGVGKPKVGGAVFVAPKGTALPTSASEELNEAYKCLGYISEDGIPVSESRESEALKAWGGDTVMKNQTSYEKSVKFTAIESENETALKVRYGTANVTKGELGALTVKHNSVELDHWAMVIDMATSKDRVTRLCYPDAYASETEDITYKDSESIGLGVTMACLPGDDGDVCKEYHAAVSAS